MAASTNIEIKEWVTEDTMISSLLSCHIKILPQLTSGQASIGSSGDGGGDGT